MQVFVEVDQGGGRRLQLHGQGAVEAAVAQQARQQDGVELRLLFGVGRSELLHFRQLSGAPVAVAQVRGGDQGHQVRSAQILLVRIRPEHRVQRVAPVRRQRADKTLPGTDAAVDQADPGGGIGDIAIDRQGVQLRRMRGEQRKQPTDKVQRRRVLEVFQAQVIGHRLLHRRLLQAVAQQRLAEIEPAPDLRAFASGGQAVDLASTAFPQDIEAVLQRVFLPADLAGHDQLLDQQRAGVMGLPTGPRAAQMQQALLVRQTGLQVSQTVIRIFQQYAAELPRAGPLQHIDSRRLCLPERIERRVFGLDDSLQTMSPGAAFQWLGRLIRGVAFDRGLCLLQATGRVARLRVAKVAGGLVELPFVTRLTGPLPGCNLHRKGLLTQVEPGRVGPA